MIAHRPRTIRWHWLVAAVGAGVMMIVTAAFGSVTHGQSDLDGEYELVMSWSPVQSDGSRQLYAVPLDGSEPRRLIPGSPEDTFDESHPDVATDGRVVFVSGPEENTDLFVWDGSGAARNITRSPWDEHDPVWSPDGTQIAFGSRDADRDIAQIFVINADGTNRRQLTDRGGGAVSPAWSSDGTRIAFRSIGARQPVENGYHAHIQLWIMDADGSNQTQITQVEAPGVSSFEWAPDGHALLVSGATTSIISADGTVVRELAPDLPILGPPSWSPDGESIAVVSRVGDDRNGPTSLVLIGADGTDPRELTHSDSVIRGLSWSPDGQQIAFVYGTIPTFESGPPPPPAADWTLSVIKRDGELERTVLHNVYRGEQVAWRRSSPP